MLKVAGWVITISAVDDWRRAHPELDQWHVGYGTATNAKGVLSERKHVGLEPLPVSEHHFLGISWPKMTKEDVGGYICLLVRRLNHNAKNETWENFTSIPHKPDSDDRISDALKKDGLKLGEWVTIPDPFQEDWPFWKRYPDASRCPPEPYREIILTMPRPSRPPASDDLY